VFNGDPRALATCALGTGVAQVATQTLTTARSLSARVWSFASTPTGPDLAHHNVFFAADPDEEFTAIAAGRMPADPTIYICAEDRGQNRPAPLLERFEIILNAAPLTAAQRPEKEASTCHQRTFPTLARFGLGFSPEPDADALTTPSGFNRLFPASAGSLYGQSPHGMTASLKRPRARTAVAGLYLAGGGTHPGAGVPMATLSGQHAAAAILKDRIST
jgi:1-hydroxycarotenoid 3,4-desaturase